MISVFETYQETDESIGKRITQICSEKFSRTDELEIYNRLLGLLDMTTLEGSDTHEKVARLCLKSKFSEINPGFPDAAAVCVYPPLARVAREELQGSGIKVAAVAGGFPAGQTSLKIKMAEVRWAVEEGAHEIDTVISRGKLLEGKLDEVFDEIAALREACGNAHLKVILETGELPSLEVVRLASTLAIEAGADFIKTSTGKIPVGATLPAFLVMLDTIKEYLLKTGKSIGIKPAGGIRTAGQALEYYMLVRAVLGNDWLNSTYFRIGASSLADALINELSGK